MSIAPLVKTILPVQCAAMDFGYLQVVLLHFLQGRLHLRYKLFIT